MWQPEGFVASSMLTNGLFMASLCLILTVFLCVLRARRGGRRAVGVGALAMAALMNVHSYDALLVGLVLLGFLAASLANRTMTVAWALRAVMIVLGALPPALWFIHVLRADPVFAARAATETYSPNFRAVFLGLLPPLLLGFVGLYRLRGKPPRGEPEEAGPRVGTAGGRRRSAAGLALAVATLLALLLLAPGHAPNSYFLTPLGWAAAFAAMVGATALLAGPSPARNLVVSWALVGTVAIYFPGLFQRKLTMGLAIPWGLLAALAVESLIHDRERSARNLVTALALILLGGSAVQWTFREVGYAAANVGSTARHPVYLGPDVQRILAYLEARPGRRVAIAMPGAPQPVGDADGHPIPDLFATPSLPDVAPFLSGLAGVYAFDGHWSETPDYPARAGVSTRFFLAAPIGRTTPLSDDERRDLAVRWGLDYAVAPIGAAFAAPEGLGEVVVPGSQFALVRLRR